MSAEQLPCAVRATRAAMSDDEFWAHVGESLQGPVDDIGNPDYDTPTSLLDTPCPECGETGACAYDAEGRPMIHATDQEDE